MSDTLADMITRIRNGQKANKVSIKARNLKGTGIYDKQLNINHFTLTKNFIFYPHSISA